MCSRSNRVGCFEFERGLRDGRDLGGLDLYSKDPECWSPLTGSGMTGDVVWQVWPAWRGGGGGGVVQCRVCIGPAHCPCLILCFHPPFLPCLFDNLNLNLNNSSLPRPLPQQGMAAYGCVTEVLTSKFRVMKRRHHACPSCRYTVLTYVEPRTRLPTTKAFHDLISISIFLIQAWEKDTRIDIPISAVLVSTGRFLAAYLEARHDSNGHGICHRGKRPSRPSSRRVADDTPLTSSEWIWTS